MIRYFSNKLIYDSGFSINPKKPYFSKKSFRFFDSKNYLNYSGVNGAAGSLVSKNLCP